MEVLLNTCILSSMSGPQIRDLAAQVLPHSLKLRSTCFGSHPKDQAHLSERTEKNGAPKAQAPDRRRALEILLEKNAETSSGRTQFKKMLAKISHAARAFMAAGVSKARRLYHFGVWAPTRRPPGPRKCQQGVHTGSSGGPSNNFERLEVAFWLHWEPPGNDFWCTFRYFSGISVTLSAILHQSSFWSPFGMAPGRCGP